MQKLLEIPITIVHTENGFTQIAPTTGPGKLPAARNLDLEQSDIEQLAVYLENWMGKTNPTARERLEKELKDVGLKAIKPLSGEELNTILDLSEAQITWRRILVYTDAESSKIPVEAMFTKENYPLGGGETGFVATHHSTYVSIVRHLGLEAENTMLIKANEPLQMLVVFSNLQDSGLSLGEIQVNEDDCLNFQGQLEAEKQALDKTLETLVRLRLLEINFLVGDESKSTVYGGKVWFDQTKNQSCWEITSKPEVEGKAVSLGKRFLDYLEQKTWHILHYFGHGNAIGDAPQLVLRPGENLSSDTIDRQVESSNNQRAKPMPRIVILHACDTASPADSKVPVLTGFATMFLLKGTVNLVCMQMKITPETAIMTTQALYNRLSQTLFTNQMDFEEALYEVRKRAHDLDRLDFFCPVLYARPVNGPIFDYQDNRLDVWKRIQVKELSLNPKTLLKVAWWSSRLL
ncbi:MAG: CHAT domain-containing protein [Anaerolineae bacterium]|nr:CHAT domain-containing protein [Anaerolineae bacterium]